MSRRSISLITLGLALTLSACASSSNPADMIPIGLRTTFGAEDRNANPVKPMTAEQLLAKLRGQPMPATPAPEPKPPAIPASWGGSNPAAALAQPASAPNAAPAEDTKPPLMELTLRFDSAAAEPRAEDGLRVQLASARASKLGSINAVIRVGPAGVDKLASISLAMRRGEAIRALLPEAIGKSADVAYAPSVEAGAARFELR